MRKNSIAICALLLLNLLLFSMPEATAGNASLTYAPNVFWSGLDEPVMEEGNTTLICQTIYNFFCNYGYNYEWVTLDYNTVYYEYYSDAFYADEYYDKVAFFSKGHAAEYNCSGGNTHRYIIDHYNDSVTDQLYGWYTDHGNYQLVFIWHCGSTEDYPDDAGYCSYCGGYYTFPLALTHSDDMTEDGYTNPTYGDQYHVFIGFDGWSIQFVENYGLYSGYYYYHYCYWIYKRLVQDHWSVIDALSDVSYLMNGTSVFTNSWMGISKTWDPPGPLPAYNSQMRVLGNGDLGIPEY
jgi:hypothetical protein